MKKLKINFGNSKLFFLFTIMAFAVPFEQSARAATAPDSFREKVIDVTSHCYPVFDKIIYTYWPNREQSEVNDLKQDARTKRDYALDMLKRYSAIYSNFNLSQMLEKGERDLGLGSVSQDELLDMAIHCEKELWKLVDEENDKGYTP